MGQSPCLKVQTCHLLSQVLHNLTDTSAGQSLLIKKFCLVFFLTDKFRYSFINKIFHAMYITFSTDIIAKALSLLLAIVLFSIFQL